MVQRTPTKADIEYYATARPHTKKEVGYWVGDKLHRGPFYSAMLGRQHVSFVHGSYIKEAGMYLLRSDALEGAKLFQEKARELLAAGEFSD